MASKKILNSYRSIEILFFIFFILIVYVLPLTNLLQIDFLKKYVAWYMGRYPKPGSEHRFCYKEVADGT